MSTDEVEVRSDPALGAEEREFNVRVADDEHHLHVYSEISALTRRLLRNERFEPEQVKVCRDDDEKFIAGVRGRLPVGCLTISADGRQSTRRSKMVSGANLDDEFHQDAVDAVHDAPEGSVVYWVPVETETEQAVA